MSTIRGSALELMEPDPRIRIDEPEPRSPEFDTMSRPARRPCRASSTEVTDRPSNSLVLMVWVAPESSRTGIGIEPSLLMRDAVTCTSERVAASCMTICMLGLMESVCGLKPTYETFILLFGFLIARENSPLKSVAVFEYTRLFLSTSWSCAPMIGSPVSSTTVPLIIDDA